MEYHSAIKKKNDYVQFIGKWKELENIIHSEVIQSQKSTLGMLLGGMASNPYIIDVIIMVNCREQRSETKMVPTSSLVSI